MKPMGCRSLTLLYTHKIGQGCSTSELKPKWIILIQNLKEENNAYAGCRNERLGRDEKRKGKIWRRGETQGTLGSREVDVI